jgi:glyoxylase-like metal-dependent hydrolase (beta-lactamase superfamily II)
LTGWEAGREDSGPAGDQASNEEKDETYRVLTRREFDMAEYEIYAIRYAGPFTSPGSFLMWLRDSDKIVEREYFIWCVKGPAATVIVDAGVSPGLASAFKLNGYVNPADILSRIDVRAEEVDHVVLTHLHWDHVNGVTLFPRATFYVQQREYDFWRKDDIAKRPPFAFIKDDASLSHLASLEGTDRLALLNGDQEILPGIDCLLAPGHSVGLQVVAVATAKGRAIVGSDCAHTFQNYAEDWPSSLIVDLVGWMKTYEKLRAAVSSPTLLFPGHDPLMAKNYPEVAERITQLV